MHKAPFSLRQGKCHTPQKSPNEPGATQVQRHHKGRSKSPNKRIPIKFKKLRSTSSWSAGSTF